MIIITLAIKIGFLELGIFDILDIVLVAFLLFQLYRLLKGSLAINIFIGLLLIFLSWFIVRALGMKLMEGILGQFIGLGVIALLIVFQPEVRRFLLYIGRESQLKRFQSLRNMFLKATGAVTTFDREISAIKSALLGFSNSRTGAIIVFANTSKLQFFANSGVRIDGEISWKLLESIFQKSSPLHDGAVIIAGQKILAAGCTLPVSENPDLPSRVGLRHKSAVGITENSDAISFVVSEENGTVSLARNGKLRLNITEKDIDKYLKVIFSGG